MSVAPAGPRGEGDRYALVFSLLILSYLLSALLSDSQARSIAPVLYLAALLLALRSAHLSRGATRRLGWIVSAGTLLTVGTGWFVAGELVGGLVAAWATVIATVTLCVVVWRILHHETVTLQTVFGALSAYLLIGFTFATLFAATASWDPAPFFAGGQSPTTANLQYFSFVTLTTTGYGDFTAAGSTGRALATMEALLGQIFLVTLVARMVSVFGTKREGSIGARRRAHGGGRDQADADHG